MPSYISVNVLDSIVNQTYRDLELLIIDDGRTDEHGVIVMSLLKKMSW